LNDKQSLNYHHFISNFNLSEVSTENQRKIVKIQS
jgi:hypothetical protein